jgi:hypothetical protein
MERNHFTHFLILALVAGTLAACTGQQHRFINDATDAGARDYLNGLSHRQVCKQYHQVMTLPPEFALAQKRLAAEYAKRKLNDKKCSEAYSICMSYGVEENTPEFANCIVNTNNTLRLEAEIRRSELLQRNSRNYCRWQPCY